MKIFIVLFCVCLGALAIPPQNPSPSDVANALFAEAKNLANKIQKYALLIVNQNGNLDAFVECTVNDVVEFITSAIATVRRLGYHDLADLATTILKSSQIAYDIFENAGISEITIIAAELSQWINDFINVLSVFANKLDNKINVVTFEVINLPALLTKPLSIERGSKLKEAILSINNAVLSILAERETIERLVTEYEQVIDIYGKQFFNKVQNFIGKVLGQVNTQLANDVKKTVDGALKLIGSGANTIVHAGVAYFDLVEIYVKQAMQSLHIIVAKLSTNVK